MESKLKELIELCKASVTLTVNDHKDYYLSVLESLNEMDDKEREEIPVGVQNKMIRMNRMVSVQFYPDTPVGFYIINHWDLEAAIEMAIAQITVDRGVKKQEV